MNAHVARASLSYAALSWIGMIFVRPSHYRQSRDDAATPMTPARSSYPTHVRCFSRLVEWPVHRVSLEWARTDKVSSWTIAVTSVSRNFLLSLCLRIRVRRALLSAELISISGADNRPRESAHKVGIPTYLPTPSRHGKRRGGWFLPPPGWVLRVERGINM